MSSWLKKILSWFGLSPVEPPKRDINVEPIQKIMQDSGMVNVAPVKKGRKKRTAQPPRR